MSGKVDLRNIKTTLGMERLSCLTPAMALKEIWVYLLAYNLIRLMMAQAAQFAHRLPRQLSFKHTVQIWIAWTERGLAAEDHDKSYDLFVLIAQTPCTLVSVRLFRVLLSIAIFGVEWFSRHLHFLLIFRSRVGERSR